MNAVKWICARWWAILSALVLAMLALAALLIAVCGIFGADALRIFYPVATWLIYPAVGIVLTVLSVRAGLSAYLGWLALPLGLGLAQPIVSATLANPGLLIIYALLGVISAATGDELRKRMRPGSSNRS